MTQIHQITLHLSSHMGCESEVVLEIFVVTPKRATFVSNVRVKENRSLSCSGVHCYVDGFPRLVGE